MGSTTTEHLLELEQRGIELSLTEWLPGNKEGIMTSNWIVKTLVNFWRKNYKRVMAGCISTRQFFFGGIPIFKMLWNCMISAPGRGQV